MVLPGSWKKGWGWGWVKLSRTHRPPPPEAPPAHYVCRCGPPSHPGRCRRKSLRCPRRCLHSHRDWAHREGGGRIEMPGADHNMAGVGSPGLGEAASLGRVLTDGAGAALPARRARAAEGVAAVIACATVAAGVGVTLELACKHMAAQWAGHIDPSRVLASSPSTRSLAHLQGPRGTYVSGRSCPSSHRHRHSRSH